jgi:hypothetical protein
MCRVTQSWGFVIERAVRRGGQGVPTEFGLEGVRFVRARRCKITLTCTLEKYSINPLIRINWHREPSG